MNPKIMEGILKLFVSGHPVGAAVLAGAGVIGLGVKAITGGNK